MKPRIMVAVSVSLILIGLSVFTRFSGSEKNEANLALVKSDGNSPYAELVSDYLTASTTDLSTEEAELSSTDLVGRQLMSEYLALAANGQVTDTTLVNLAEKYVESIPTLVSAEQILGTELKVETNSKANFQKYADAILPLYREYGMKMAALEPQDVSMGPAFLEMASQMAGVYSQTALKLKNLPVPAEIASTQLELVNIYLKNSAAMANLSNSVKDPASAFAGLIAITENADLESALWVKIERILNDNGV